MHGLFAFRVNFAITFLGAFLLIFLIRLTALLPSQYYFSFSKLVAGDRGPFMIDPPSVTGAKLCELLRANHISAETLRSTSVDCRLVREGDKKQDGPRLSTEAIDRIYSVALQSDTVVRDILHQRLRAFSFIPIAKEELDEIINRSNTINDAFDGVDSTYSRQLESAFAQPLSEAYQKQLPNINPDLPSEPKEAKMRISVANAEKVRASNAAFLSRFDDARHGISLKPIQKSNVDEIIKTSGGWSVPSELSKFYVDQIETAAKAKLRDEFAAHQIAPVDRKEARQLIFRQISSAGLNDYLISVGVRLLPVVVFGFVLGLMFGASELPSIGLAAAFTAFLLSWPLILMWDKLVGYQWQAQRPLFLFFYAVYVLSFFVTARMSGLWGAGLRNLVAPVSAEASESEKDMMTVTGKEVMINILAGIATNGLLYAWNVLLPLAAAQGS